jgi:hypothetical protein
LSFIKTFGFDSSPFGDYVAENEPQIEEYAVRPPFLETVNDYAHRCSSFILFGHRGSGKSATRLTVYKEIWREVSEGKKAPLVVNMTDFSRVMSQATDKFDRAAFAREAAFSTVEAVLVWLASLKEEDREAYTEGLNKNERSVVSALLRHAYLSVPEFERNISSKQALRLLNQAWHTRAELWVEKKLSPLATLVASVASGWMKRNADTSGQEEEAIRQLLVSLGAVDGAKFTLAAYDKLAEFAQIFGFSGVVVAVDKLDETDQTTNSSQKTAALLYPLLSQIQALEINNFGWTFFVWDRVKEHLSRGDLSVRLDKIAHAEIAWEPQYIRQLIDRRVSYFSSGKVTQFSELLDPSLNGEQTLDLLARIAMMSPRELIRLLDTIVREYDQHFVGRNDASKLTSEIIDKGIDQYVKDVVPTIYPEKIVRQFVRLGRSTFTNKEVQGEFRIGGPAARNRITGWVDAGMVRQSGTRPAEGDQGGKPQNEYSILDGRLIRIVERRLIEPEESDDEFDQPI